MRRTIIDRDSGVFTVVNEFEVSPEQQERMRVDLPAVMTEVVCRQPGFVSGNVHLSHDGIRVFTYYQWESEEAFRAYRDDTDTWGQVMAVVARYGPVTRAYEVAFQVWAGPATT